MEDLPLHIPITFWIATFATLIFLLWAMSNMKKDRYKANIIFMGITGWLILQAILAKEGIYYSHLEAIPPLLMVFGLLPMIVLILLLFISRSGRKLIDQLPVKQLTILHVVRIPVELVLYWLMLETYIAEVMTFEGRNFDILAGVTAIFVGLMIKDPLKARGWLIVWNLLALGLLFNIVATAVLSAPFPFQQMAFEQPNVAVLYFPYVWLPVFIVPAVLFSHLVCLRKLIYKVP